MMRVLLYIISEFLKFYKQFPGIADHDYTSGSMEFFQSLQLASLSSEMQLSLLSKVTSEEIIRTLKGMPHNKSLEHDGYIVEFFSCCLGYGWTPFYCAVKEFFSSSRLLKQLNTTSLALIPKVPQPSLVTDFSPIACRNIVYKCISKILANKLKVNLPHLITSN